MSCDRCKVSFALKLKYSIQRLKDILSRVSRPKMKDYLSLLFKDEIILLPSHFFLSLIALRRPSQELWIGLLPPLPSHGPSGSKSNETKSTRTMTGKQSHLSWWRSLPFFIPTQLLHTTALQCTAATIHCHSKISKDAMSFRHKSI